MLIIQSAGQIGLQHLTSFLSSNLSVVKGKQKKYLCKYINKYMNECINLVAALTVQRSG